MRILQVVHGFPPKSNGGTEKYTYQLSSELARRHEVHVTYPVVNRQPQVTKQDENGIHIHEIRTAAPRSYLDPLRLEASYRRKGWELAFGELIEALRPDLVHFQHFLYMSVGFVDLTQSCGVPSIMTLHDYWFLCPTVQMLRWDGHVCGGPEPSMCRLCWADHRSRALSGHVRELVFMQPLRLTIRRGLLALNPTAVFERRIRRMQESLRKANLLIAPSQFLRNMFTAHGVRRESILYSENGYAAKLQPASLEFDNDRPIVFGYIGRIVPTKGVSVLVDAFMGLPEAEARLLIFGHCSDKSPYVRDLMTRTRDAKNISFRGHVADIQLALAEIDVLVFPSVWYENCPLVLAERRLVGRPVIASNIGAIPEFVSENDGCLFEPGNPEDLLSKMTNYVRNPQIAAQQAASIQVKPRSMADQAYELEGLYEMCVRQG